MLGLDALCHVGFAPAQANELAGSNNGLTATAGGGQTSALLLTATINRITTCATNADSVKLPYSQPGARITIINSAATNAIQVYGSGTDTVNDVATGTGVAQSAGVAADYICPVAGKWYCLRSL